MPRSTRPQRRRLLSAAALSVGLAATVAGCSVFSPMTTAMDYPPSDGHQLDLDTVGVRNIMIVAKEKGAPGQLFGSVVNNGLNEATVTFTNASGALAPVKVPAKSVVNLAPLDLSVANTPQPGTLMPFRVSVGQSAGDLTVPIQDGSLPEYATLVPTGAPSSAPASSPAATSPAASPSPTS